MLRAILRSLKQGILRRAEVEDRMADELWFHIEARADALNAAGMTRDEALRQARIEFGSAEKYKEEMRRARGLRLFDELRGDVKYALRVLRKSPAFSLAAVFTLSLGIAANSAVFSLINEVFLRKLQVGQPDELVQFDWLQKENAMVASFSGSGQSDPSSGLAAMTSFSYKTFETFRDKNRTLSDVFAFNPMFQPINVVVEGASQIAHGELVSGNYFTALQVPAAAGRTILPDDDQEDAHPVAVISDRYWNRRFGRAADTVGKSISINGASFTVIGISPEGFFGTKVGDDPEVWLPFAMHSRVGANEYTVGEWPWWVEMMGRSKPGVTRTQILADLLPLFDASVREAYDARPAKYRGERFNRRTVIPPLRVNDGSRGPIAMRRHYSPMLMTLLVIVGLILLIVCANLANLLLARASYRRQEISIRLAIGASRRRLVRQLMTESVLLALLGGALGSVLTIWGKDFLSWLPDAGLDTLSVTPSIDWRVILFTMGVSVAAGLLFGVIPGLRATKSGLAGGMRFNTSRGGSQRLLVSRSLLTAQVGLCLVLLIGAGLVIRSVRNLLTAEIGFNPHNVVLFDLNPELNRYDKVRAQQLYENTLAAIRDVPGVESATMSGIRPILGGGWWMGVKTTEVTDNREDLSAYVQNIGPKFLETMEMPLLGGRALTPADETTTPKAVVINQTLARKLFSNENPIGKRFQYSEPTMRDHFGFEVVGLARDSRYDRIEKENPSIMYVPFSEGSGQATFEIRTRIDAYSLMPAIRDAVGKVDHTLPLMDMNTLEDQIRSEIGLYRMFAAFSSIFGSFAVLMACIGFYGIVSYSVTSRINELGIRMALGARPADVIRLIMRGTWFVTGLGLLVGLAGALAVTRFIADWLLYGVSAYDPLTIIAAMALIAVVSALAAYIPARRASRVDPMIALRYE